MIVPRYWAQSRLQQKRTAATPRQLTVKRYGWSNTSQAEAQQIADARAQEALQAILAGDRKQPRFEPPLPYGIEGIPIREDIVEERGDLVLTRNRYGALCLNVPDIAFLDIDCPPPSTPWLLRLVTLPIGFALGMPLVNGQNVGIVILAALGIIAITEFVASKLWKRIIALQGGVKARALKRIRQFFEQHANTRAALYETPGGYRLLFTHTRISPHAPEIEAWHQALKADPEYVALCRMQNCFRARVTPKPWRIGVKPLRQVIGAVWPLTPEQLAKREPWIAEYNAQSQGHAACRFVEMLGMGASTSAAESVRTWHDELSQAHSALPLA